MGSRLSPHSCARTCWTFTTNIDHVVTALQRENLYGFLNRTKETASAPRQRCRRPAQLECPQTARTESEAPSLCANPTSLHDTGTSTTAGTAPATPPRTCRRNNGHGTTLSKNCTNARRRPAQQGHRPPPSTKNSTKRSTNAASPAPRPPPPHPRPPPHRPTQ